MKCVIVGSGNSLRGFNFWQLKDKIDVIAVNRAVVAVPFAKHLTFWDKTFYHNPISRKLINNFKGQVHTITGYGEYPKCKGFKYYSNQGRGIINRVPGLVGNNNSGIIFALNVAINLGYSYIYLIGCDNAIDGSGYIHFYDKDRALNLRKKQYENSFNTFNSLFQSLLRNNQFKENENIVFVEPTTIENYPVISMNEFLSVI